MNIGETIKKLRKQKDMTQEQLAEYLNISPQAISRWEINSTLPDITLVPMLANIFDVTTDTLLGVDIDAKEKRIKEITNEALRLSEQMQYAEAESTLRTALKEYPNSYVLMGNLVSELGINAIVQDRKWDDEKKKAVIAERKPVLDEIIAICEKILAECTEDNLRHIAIQHLCFTYAFLGETEKAKTFANKMPSSTYAQENLIGVALKGTEKHYHLRDRIVRSLFYEVLNSIIALSTTPLDDGAELFTSDEQIIISHKVVDIINIFIEDGNFGDFSFRLVGSHGHLASLYGKKGDGENALKHFRLAAKYGIVHESMPSIHNAEKMEEYTCLLFNGVKFPFNFAHMPYTWLEHLQKISKELETVVPAAELEEVLAKLREHDAGR